MPIANSSPAKINIKNVKQIRLGTSKESPKKTHIIYIKIQINSIIIK